MIRMLCLTLLVVALLPLAPAGAVAVPLGHDRDLALAAPAKVRAAPAALAAARPIARAPLLVREVVLLPSRAILLRPLRDLPRAPLRAGPQAAPPLTVPLPGALPHFVVALAALVFVARRRPGARPLAGDGASP
jgi:hypothetical protein